MAKVALVTGGSRGIGAAIARRLAGDGMDVVITYARAAGRAETVVKEIERQGRRGLAALRSRSRPAPEHPERSRTEHEQPGPHRAQAAAGSRCGGHEDELRRALGARNGQWP